MMSEFAEGEGTVNQPFWKNLPDVPGYFERKLPTMDRTLDTYFDQNFEAIIEEWGLLKGDDLIELERKLNRVTDEITRLNEERTIVIDRVERLEAMITVLEGAVR